MKTASFPAVGAAVVALCGPSVALTLEFAGPAEKTGTRADPMTSYLMPIGPYADGTVPARRIEGPLDQTAWRIDVPGLTTLQLLQPLRAQLTAAGYSVIYECEAVTCGGFDFRFGTEVLPEPDMHVDLGDFRYLAADRGNGAATEHISLIVSRAVDQGFVQVTQITEGGLPPSDPPSANRVAAAQPPQALDGLEPASPLMQARPADAEQTPRAAPSAGLGDRLMAGGVHVLGDLAFDSGSAVLSEGEFASLDDLASFLRANPRAKVLLVGHTDAAGGLEANIALSRQRAQSVRQRLLTGYGIPPDQVGAEGVGFLSPRASNATEAGRVANRRVEVMLMDMGTN